MDDPRGISLDEPSPRRRPSLDEEAGEAENPLGGVGGNEGWATVEEAVVVERHRPPAVLRKQESQKGPAMTRVANSSDGGRKKKALSFHDGWHGDETHKVAKFRAEGALGITMGRGPSKGHLPTLETALEVDNGKAGAATKKVMLDVGDTMISVAGESLVDSPDPYEAAIALIQSHTERPLEIKFITHSSPAPYTTLFHTAKLGISITAAMSAAEYPAVWQRSEGYAGDFPARGDVLLAVNGVELVSTTDKMAEAAEAIQNSPERPIRLLFQPHVDDSHKVAVFREERLGINLATGASTGHLPVLASDVQAENGVRHGAGMALKAGDQLAAVAGSSLVESADPFAKAIELISEHTQRPLTLHFIDGDKPGPYSVVYHAVSMGIGVDVAPAGLHGGPKGFPIVAKVSTTSSFPKVGDQLFRVDGHTLRDPQNKMEEAQLRLREGLSQQSDGSGGTVVTRRKPLQVLFLPGKDPAHISRFKDVVAGGSISGGGGTGGGGGGGSGGSRGGRSGVVQTSMDDLAQYTHSGLIAQLARHDEQVDEGESDYLCLLARLRTGLHLIRVGVTVSADNTRSSGSGSGSGSGGGGGGGAPSQSPSIKVDPTDVVIYSTPRRKGIYFYRPTGTTPVALAYSTLEDVTDLRLIADGGGGDGGGDGGGSSGLGAALKAELSAEELDLGVALIFTGEGQTKMRLLLICPSEHVKHIVVHGFNQAPAHWKTYAENDGDESGGQQQQQLQSQQNQQRQQQQEMVEQIQQQHKQQKDSRWSRFGHMTPHSKLHRVLGHFHHLFRPHHTHSHGPRRYPTGVIAEVHYPSRKVARGEEWTDADEERYQRSLFKIYLMVKRKGKWAMEEELNLPLPCFQPGRGLFLCAKITKYDRATGRYRLEYCHGPYLPYETPSNKRRLGVKKFPQAVARFVIDGVDPHLISVDMSQNYSSHFPLFILGVTTVQCLAFLYYISTVDLGDDDLADVTATTPVAGPQAWWMKVIGDMPTCNDLRPQYWRPFSYQLVHSGYNHIIFNALTQLFFGMPINMVHGNGRFLLMYELGVLGGAINWVLIAGGQGALVGCSGGVYAIFGMHTAELVMNWESNAKGILSHWFRLLMIGFVLGIDTYLYYGGGADSHVSVAAHVGGFLVGLVVGIVTVENFDQSTFQHYVVYPMAYVVGFGMLTWGLYNYGANYPPEAQIWDTNYDTCCYQLLKCTKSCGDDYDYDDAGELCGELEEEHFEVFGCKYSFDEATHEEQEIVTAGTTSGGTSRGAYLHTCMEMEDYYGTFNFGG